MTPLLQAPTFRALGDVVVKRRSSNATPQNNDNTNADDDTLQFNVSANEAWVFEFGLIVDSSAVADFKFEITVPAAATGRFQCRSQNASLSNASALVNFATDTVVGGVGAGTPILGAIGEGVVNVGATAGAVKVRWAQNTTEVSDTTLCTGSYLIARRIT